MAIGMISGAIPVLQPLLLGQLATEGRITLPQIGQTAMAEALGIAIAASVAGALLPPQRHKLIIPLAAIFALGANLATTQVSDNMVLVIRLLCGASAGVMQWLWIGMLARVKVPARLIAIYVTIQASSLLALSYLLTNFLIPWMGSSAGYVSLAAINALVIVLTLGIPGRYSQHPDTFGGRLPSGRGLLGLAAVFLHLGAILALWVYVVPLGRQEGHSNEFIGLAISIGCGFQIVAGLTAATFATRLNSHAAVIGCILTSLAAVILLGLTTSGALFATAVAIIAAFWMFAPPFHMPYLISLDPSRRTAMQILTAQMLGVAMGPALASVTVTSQDASGAIVVSGLMFFTAGVIVGGTALWRTEKI